MPPDDFVRRTTPLRSLGMQRVWSLMISLFGDMTQAEGAGIDGPVLSGIMTGLDVKPEAARVALHRLRNDGWITSRKSGRISRHALSAKGRAETIAASPRIYAPPPGAAQAWQLVLLPESDSAELPAGFTPVTPRVIVGPADAKAPAKALVLQGAEVPGWLREELRPAALEDDYLALLGALEEVMGNLPEGQRLSPMEVATLRCLVVHNWRRLVLKHPALPGALVDRGAAAHRCHLLVHALLARFPRPALRDLSPAATDG
jgi:phenylacetic acid degradation operon negative regulatory protein